MVTHTSDSQALKVKTVADFLLNRLHQWGVRRIYGYPGDGINGILGSLQRAEDTIDFIQTRHEEMAAFMACAHAKFTGEVGVCLATSGPGAIHLLNGLYDAKKDNMPVVAIVGQMKTFSLGSDYQQEVDLVCLFKDVASQYVQMVAHPSGVRTAVDQAFRIAKASRDVTCVIVPADLQEESYDDAPRIHGCTYSGVGYSEPRVVPTQKDLHKAAEILNEGEKVAMLIGAGALNATDEVMEMAERLGAGVAKALLGKAAIDDGLPYCTGPIGLLGSEPSDYIMKNCDTLLMVGTSFPYSEWLPKPGQARGVQIDIKPRKLSLRYPMEAPLHGDSKLTLQALLEMIDYKRDRSWRDDIEKRVADWWKVLRRRAYLKADPINPQLLFWKLSPKLPENAIITSDSGSAANWFARDLKIRPPMMASLSGGLATMLPGVPYVIAAKFAFPDRPAIALVGDGAMQMLGNNELITIAKYWREWSDPRLIICVLNNKDLNQVTWEQRVLAGDPKFSASQDIPNFAYARYADMLGLGGFEVFDSSEIDEALDTALNADRPFVLDVHTDPNVAPLPPHITFEQARKYLVSILKGDPDSPRQVTQSLKGLAQSWLPTRK